MKLRYILAPILALCFKASDQNGLSEQEYRMNTIRNYFIFTWVNYKTRAMGADELRPMDGTPDVNVWGGWGVTLVDSLDTLWLMDLKEEFRDAVAVIAQIDFSKGTIATSFFEVTIRNLGGLIAAYDLSGERVLLQKAKELADVLMLDFDSPSGFPYTNFDFRAQQPVREAYASLANIGSCQLEFARMSQLTGDPKYFNAALKVYDVLDQNKPGSGLYYADLDVNTGKFTSKTLTYGAIGDSFYEYLIKLRVMLGPQNGAKYLRMFDESMIQFKSQLLVPCYGNRLCLGFNDRNGKFQPLIQHLNFFVPGMLLLGDGYLPGRNLSAIGLDLLETFSHIPRLARTGLAPELVSFSPNAEMRIESKANILRPELVESFFYAYRATHNPIYQDRTWAAFQAFRNYSLANYGFSEYADVTDTYKKFQQRNAMPSFFLAETFKYMYLTFAPDSKLNLNQWVFNTEAHPFKIST
ncbi:hypothetical protein DSO57_1021267 [Entomophthora muscae]|uniref:Uncharacterized protein n=1 Tax=Entomophthora muscae TaxID=34485 RepID=A0ACC2S5N7_9FUNG|nr:hypothetical protein DSO57_1021267 [Entomophthora muscae]